MTATEFITLATVFVGFYALVKFITTKVKQRIDRKRKEKYSRESITHVPADDAYIDELCGTDETGPTV